MVFGSREMVSGHRSMVLPGSDMPSALGLVVNVIRLSSGEKLGVLSQGPGIVYDVKMVGLKVNLEMQDIEIH